VRTKQVANTAVQQVDVATDRPVRTSSSGGNKVADDDPPPPPAPTGRWETYEVRGAYQHLVKAAVEGLRITGYTEPEPIMELVSEARTVIEVVPVYETRIRL